MCPVRFEAPVEHSTALEQQTTGNKELRQSCSPEATRKVVVVKVLKDEIKKKTT